jgi:TetR/AcrR family transcriptional regulator
MMARAEERMGFRQRAGEVTPGFALLVTYAVILVPITMPQFVRDIFGDDPLPPAVRQQLPSQLVRLLGEAGD